MPSLSHLEKKDSTVKWFIIAIIPIINLYYLWKLAETVSGHEKGISEEYEVVKHMDEKEPTWKWFGIFLIPSVIGVIAASYAVTIGSAGATGMINPFSMASAGIVFALSMIISIIIGIYILYVVSISISGHEKKYKEYEMVAHMDKKESTAKWMIFGIIPILNLYWLWKAAEMVSGHEVVHK